MALPSSGPMTAAMINVELGRAANAAFSISGPAERALAGIPSGPIKFSDFYGKSRAGPVPFPSRSWMQYYTWPGASSALTWMHFTSEGEVRCLKGTSPGGTPNVLVFRDYWYDPLTTNIGDSYWIRGTLVSGSPPNNPGTDAPLNQWVPISGTVGWHNRASISSSSGYSNRTMSIFVELSTTPNGSNVIGSATYSMLAEVEGNQ